MPLRALTDQPIRNPRLWLTLGWLEIVQSYRRTFLGPIWITLNMVIFSLAIGTVYGGFFGDTTADYMAYILCGMIGWFWYSGLLIDGGNTFRSFARFIKSMPMDKAQLVWAAAYKHLVILGHNLIVYLGFIAIGMVQPNLYTLLAIPAIALVFLLSIPAIATLSLLYARFPDVPRLVGSTIIVIMLLTPILWKAEMVPGWRTTFVQLNPFYYLIEFVRRPLLGEPPDLTVVAVVLGMTVFFWALGTFTFNKYHRYVVFWV